MLGKLTASIAHELNHPAAAVRRSAQQLRTHLLTVQQDVIQLHQLALRPEQLQEVVNWQKATLIQAASTPPTIGDERSRREEQMGNWLFGVGIDDAWEMAETFVYFHVTLDCLKALLAHFAAHQVPLLLHWQANSLAALRLVDEVSRSAERMSDLVNAIKTNTHMENGPPRKVDLHKNIEETLTVLGHKLKNIEVLPNFDPTLPPVMGRSGELYQVWTNLLDNAIDAVEGIGKVTITTALVGDEAVVTVEDNGPGIAPDVLPHIFEPFFTTKQEGLGSGLGLEIVQRIVTQHGGTISVESHPGATRFVVRLPIQGGGVTG